MVTPDEARELSRRVPPQILFGTSTWTYPGWAGIVYPEYPAKATAADMLAQYARFPLFRTVGIDSFFYRPPDQRTLVSYAAALPPDFRCASKVWNRITAHTFKSPRAGTTGPNPDWLNADLFAHDVLGPMQQHFAGHIGPLIFELEAIPRGQLGAIGLAERLDRFFAALPRGPDCPYAVEIRNREFLTDDYFMALRRHNVAHVFNAWTRMPSIGEQFVMHDALTADFMVARALLRPGRKYQDAVDAFAPYDRIQDENGELRSDLAALALAAIADQRRFYLLVNNRAEGCAPETIAAVARLITGAPPAQRRGSAPLPPGPAPATLSR